MTGFGAGWALLIGAGGDLPATVEDAGALAALLADAERGAYPSEQVRLLTGPQATRGAVLLALDELARCAGPEATALVYFSGHGYMVGSSALPPTSYLLTYGYDLDDPSGTCVSSTEFTSALRAVQTKKLVVLLDCCHAAGMAMPKAAGPMPSKTPLPLEVPSVLSAGSGRVILASSRRDEYSYVGATYSEFTQALLEGLSGAGAAEPDGYARILDLALYAGHVVPNRTGDRQHPIINVANLENNFAVAYCAGRAAAPAAPGPAGSQAGILTTQPADPDLQRAYRQLLGTYRRNLLELEGAIAQFIDQRAVPPDFLRARALLLQKISQLNLHMANQVPWPPTR